MIIDEIDDFFGKNSDTMICIKKSYHIFEDKVEIPYEETEYFIWHITDKVREIQRKNFKIENFCGNFHRYHDRHTNTIRM